MTKPRFRKGMVFNIFDTKSQYHEYRVVPMIGSMACANRAEADYYAQWPISNGVKRVGVVRVIKVKKVKN